MSQKPAHRQFTEPIFARLAEYSASLAEHPLLTAARRGELSRPTLDELAFHQYSDSILWIPMLAQMKSSAHRSARLRKAIEDNIAHEAGIHLPPAASAALPFVRDAGVASGSSSAAGGGSTSHVALAVAMMRSLGLTSLERFPTRTFASSATLWLSDEFAHMNEPMLAGWLLTAETLVPQMFAAVVEAYDAVEGADTRYFHEHVHIDSDEHATWMAEAVDEIVGLYGPACVADVLEGMRDAWEETRSVPDALWAQQEQQDAAGGKRIALAHNLRDDDDDDEAHAEHDRAETIAMLRDELTALGHVVLPIDVNGPVYDVVTRLAHARCDVVFNIAEGTTGRAREAFWPALYEQLGLAYTGSDARVLAVCLDKALAKRIVATAGVDVPRGVLVRSRAEGSFDVEWPVSIVKPNAEGSSKGITQRSIVGAAELPRVVDELLARYPDGVLVEEYVDGIDVAVPFVEALGGVLPALTYDNAPRILDYHTKQRDDVVVRVASGHVDARVQEVARRAFAALEVRGFGRADFRLTPDGRAVFLEMNPLPSLAAHDPELFLAAAHAGYTRRDVMAAIVG